MQFYLNVIYILLCVLHRMVWTVNTCITYWYHMLMHKGMVKQRLMRLMKCNKVLVREDFLATFTKSFSCLRNNWTCPLEKKPTICRGTRHVTLQNFPVKHPLCYRYCNNLQNMNKKMPKINNKMLVKLCHRDFSTICGQDWSLRFV